MDTSNHHFDTSIFRDYNMLWWDGTISWKNKYIDGDPKKGRVKWYFGINKPVQLTDAFHFFKMWMIIFICSAIVSVLYVDIELEWYSFFLFLLGYGTTWNVVFSGFYDKILKKD
jgi:tryptophan-rich sensory protein